jgi:hypothetical protein
LAPPPVKKALQGKYGSKTQTHNKLNSERPRGIRLAQGGGEIGAGMRPSRYHARCANAGDFDGRLHAALWVSRSQALAKKKGCTMMARKRNAALYLLGMWAAEKLGITGRDAEAYSDALAVGTLDPERSERQVNLCAQAIYPSRSQTKSTTRLSSSQATTIVSAVLITTPSRTPEPAIPQYTNNVKVALAMIGAERSTHVRSW